MPSQSISLRYLSILSSHLHLHLPSKPQTSHSVNVPNFSLIKAGMSSNLKLHATCSFPILIFVLKNLVVLEYFHFKLIHVIIFDVLLMAQMNLHVFYDMLLC